jgi:[protein-PII] uridylyltransferase
VRPNTSLRTYADLSYRAAMDAAVATHPLDLPTPDVDWQAARIQLTETFRRAGESASGARPQVVLILADLVKRTRSKAREDLERTGRGRACAADLARAQDELIRLIYDYTVAHVYQPSDPTGADRITVVATGGYGRGLLAPGSDIDLLFLLPAKQTGWGESVVEYMLYVLWDLRFKVGHATRTIEQCLKLSLNDMTIRTSLLDARLLFGDRGLFEALMQRFRSEVVAGTAKPFIEAKLAERDERHRRTGESRYKVEPNVKDGKGGLRDLHTLHWLATYVHGPDALKAHHPDTMLSASEAAAFRRCESFLWTVRCHLHFLTNKPDERLAFEWQPQIAAKLGYTDRGGLRAVERFMKHYFLIAKEVGDLTTTLCATLEMQQFKQQPTFAQMLNPLTWRQRRQVRKRTDFRIDNGRINVVDADVFKRDPLNILRYFAYAEETGAFLHPDALRLIRASERLVDDNLRADPEANRIFLNLLTSPKNPEATLRRMNEAGVLGRFLPDFGRVVAMTQFNMYHHFTVDEHLLRTVGELKRIEEGAVAVDLPLSTEIIKTIQSRRALYVASFLHDIGKGAEEDHSILGARIARRLGPQLGLEPAETETVAWLIEQHLTMSTIAQSRDLGDPQTIRAFADVVQSPERLKLLLLLTVADIRAVGPSVWNGWKGQLLRTLYHETEPLVSGGVIQRGGKHRVGAAETAFRAAAAKAGGIDAEAFIAQQYPEYWLKTEVGKQIDHARMVAQAKAGGETLVTHVTTDGFRGVTELSILAPDHARLLALFAGACAAADANIVGAYVSTTRDGFALDTFLLQRSFDDDEDEMRRAKRIGSTIRKVLGGEARLATLLAKRQESKPVTTTFRVPPEVVIDNALSEALTVIEVAGLDRPGLLYDLTTAISDLNLNIASAHVTTFGEKAVDVFYVADLTGKKISSPAREKTIRERLVAALTPPSS